MTKRFISVLMLLLMLVSVVSCGTSDGEMTSDTDSAVTAGANSESEKPDEQTETVTEEITNEVTDVSTTISETDAVTTTQKVEVTTKKDEEKPVELLPAAKLDQNKIKNHEKISLWPENNIPFEIANPNLPKATIQAYLVDGSDKCVVIFPGGGYFQVTQKEEGYEIAEAYNKKGISAFVACYRHNKPYDGNAILADAQRAIQFVRYYAGQFGINKDKIAVCGFSAGGHLAMLTAQHTPEKNLVGDVIGAEKSTPDACILGYPVLTLAAEYTYPTMPDIFLGAKQNDNALREKYSYEYNLKAMPETFVFYSVFDATVDRFNNGVAFKNAMKKINKVVEYKEYGDGGHGIGLGVGTSSFSRWFDDSVEFLKKNSGF